MFASSYPTSQMNASRNTRTLLVMTVMAGSTLKYPTAITAFPKLAFLPMIYFDPTLLPKVSMKQLPRQASGATNGGPFNSASLWLILVLNT
jgi:hypothetical protein